MIATLPTTLLYRDPSLPIEERVKDLLARMTPDEKETAWGTVLAFEPPRLLEVEWRYEGEDESILRIELEPRGEATLLVLDHRLLQAGQAPGYGSGWHAYLDALDDLLAGRAVGGWDERFQARLEDYRQAAAATVAKRAPPAR